MSRTWGIVSGAAIGCALVCALAAPASAQSFGALVDQAQSVESPKAIAALFWSHTADCSKATSDLAKRQCRGIVAARKAQLAGSTVLVKAGAGAVVASAFNAKTKSASLKIRGCVACAAPLEVGGKRVFVVAGAGAVMGKAGGVSIAPAHSMRLKFSGATSAARFANEVLPRLKAQLVLKVGSPKAWQSGPILGYRVDLLGFRVYDPCDGKVYAAKPKSSSVAPDKRYCSGEPVADEPADESAKEVVETEPTLPSRLSPSQLRDGLDPARKASARCFEAYGVPGTARLRITISGEGDVIGVREKGDFVGTPTSKCIRAAVKKATFPKTRRASTTIDYPFILR